MLIWMLVTALLTSAAYYLGDTVRRGTVTTHAMDATEKALLMVVAYVRKPEWLRAITWSLVDRMDVRNTHWRSVVLGIECYDCAVKRIEREEAEAESARLLASFDDHVERWRGGRTSALQEFLRTHPEVPVEYIPTVDATKPEDVFGPLDCR